MKNGIQSIKEGNKKKRLIDISVIIMTLRKF